MGDLVKTATLLQVTEVTFEKKTNEVDMPIDVYYNLTQAYYFNTYLLIGVSQKIQGMI